MTDRGMTVLQSCVGSAVLTAVTGGFFLSTWTEALLVFLIFAIAMFFTIDHAMHGRNSH